MLGFFLHSENDPVHLFPKRRKKLVLICFLFLGCCAFLLLSSPPSLHTSISQARKANDKNKCYPSLVGIITHDREKCLHWPPENCNCKQTYLNLAGKATTGFVVADVVVAPDFLLPGLHLTHLFSSDVEKWRRRRFNLPLQRRRRCTQVE